MAANPWLLGHLAQGTSWSSLNLLCFSKWLPIHIYLATKLQSLLDSIQTWPAAQNGCQSVITWPVEQSLPSCYSKWLPLETCQIQTYLPFKMAANPYSLGHLSQVTPWFNPDLTICSKWLPLLKLYAQWSCSCGHQPPSLFTIRISRHAHASCMQKRGTLIFVQQATFSEVPSFFLKEIFGLWVKKFTKYGNQFV